MFVSLREIGLYSVGASFGLAMKLFLSAFENAWAPFYFADDEGAGREADLLAGHDVRPGGARAARGRARGRVAPTSCG